ncbi:hypothetical protein [uncultured Dialister sp.]|jgi:hypothetical protein|uniref:hypothetical protein n=1 Tax=uncultured Dialister sp. TaxID=278064 RepID=UPI0025CC6E40|nr:hypothetical protein [uncultured Dialister sp.]
MKQDMRVALKWQEWIIDLRKNVLRTGTLNWGNKGKTVREKQYGENEKHTDSADNHATFSERKGEK